MRLHNNNGSDIALRVLVGARSEQPSSKLAQGDSWSIVRANQVASPSVVQPAGIK